MEEIKKSLRDLLLDDNFNLDPNESDEERDSIINLILESAGVNSLSVPKEQEEEEYEGPPHVDSKDDLPGWEDTDEETKDEETKRVRCHMPSVHTDTISIQSSSSSIPMDVSTAIHDFLLGMTIGRTDLMVLEGENVLMRKDHFLMEDKVKLLSGGRWGYDPLFTGYVGKGLLTAVVLGDDQGNVPKPDAILTALKQLSYNHDMGIIVIVLNYLDDRLNFGVAVELARLEGIKVEMVTVGDDCWESIDDRIGRKGLIGIVLLFKIAGAMSEDGLPMKELYGCARAVCSTGMTTVSATLGSKPIVGTGLDGSHTRGEVLSSHSTMETIVAAMLKYATNPNYYFSLRLDPSSTTVVLINCYTGDRSLLYSAANEIVSQLQKIEIPMARVYTGNFVSGKRGISITLLREYGDNVIKWLDKSTPVDIWPKGWGLGQSPVTVGVVEHVPLPSLSGCKTPGTCSNLGPNISSAAALRSSDILKMVCKVLVSAEESLNELDPEGYYGTGMKTAAKALLEARREGLIHFDRPFFMMRVIGEICQLTMPGITGTMYQCLFAGSAQVLLQFIRCTEMTILMWYQTALGGMSTLRSYTKLRTGDVTLVDALTPALKAMEALSSNEADSFLAVVEAAEAGTNSTKFKTSVRKRPYVVEVGAQTVCLWLRALYYAMLATAEPMK